MTSAGLSWTRFALAAILLAGTSLFLHARDRAEILPGHRELDALPKLMDGWMGTDQQLSDDVLRVLGPGEFLMRNYERAGQPAPVNLFIAFFPSQRTGDTIHSPKNCLPGAGWAPLESGKIEIKTLDGSTISANRYIVGQGMERALVIYWYQSHGRAIASEYWAKFYLVADSIRLNRTDGALVRVITPISPGEDPRLSEGRAVRFAQLLLPQLDSYIPR